MINSVVFAMLLVGMKLVFGQKTPKIGQNEYIHTYLILMNEHLLICSNWLNEHFNMQCANNPPTVDLYVLTSVAL